MVEAGEGFTVVCVCNDVMSYLWANNTSSIMVRLGKANRALNRCSALHLGTSRWNARMHRFPCHNGSIHGVDAILMVGGSSSSTLVSMRHSHDRCTRSTLLRITRSDFPRHHASRKQQQRILGSLPSFPFHIECTLPLSL